MKAGWQTKSLADTCNMYQPKTISGKEMQVDGAYPVFGANGIIGRYNQFNHAEPQLLITCRGATCGAVNVSLPNSWITGNAMVVRPKDDSIDLRYLEYYFRGGIDISTAITGAAQPQITRTNLEPLPIRLPNSLDEQRRIVTVLDKAFASIATATANAQKNLTNARALFDSYVDDVFDRPDDSWRKQTIGDIAQIKGGKRVPKGYKLLNEPTPFPYISVADFNDEGSVDTRKIRYISEQIFTQIKRYIIRKEDLYVSIAGTVGKTGIVPPELDGASLTENACRLVLNSDVVNRFVYFFTLTTSFKEQAIEQTRTAAQPKLALSRLQQISLPIPSKNTQEQLIEKFSDLADRVRQVEGIYEQKLTALSELKQSLLQKAFAGELS